MYTSEPKYLNFTNYNKASELEKEIKENICTDLYFNNVVKNITGIKDIPIGTIFLHLSYDDDYYCILIEKCVFLGYLFNSTNTKSDDFVLLFNSLDLQNNIKISPLDFHKEIYYLNNKDNFLNAIKSYYSSYKIFKNKIFEKIGKLNQAISLINEINILDEKDIISPNLKKYSDVYLEDNLLTNIINNLITLNKNYYKMNRINTLEGKKNDADFIKRMKNMLLEKRELLLNDEIIDNESEEKIVVKRDNSKEIEEENRIEDNKQLF